MITLICKRIPTTVNRKNETKANTHMKWRSFGSESPSGLHCTNRYWSTDHPMNRSSNCLCIGSRTSTNLDRVRVSFNGQDLTKRVPKYCSTQPTHTCKHKYMLNTLPSTPIHMCTPTYIHIHMYIQVYTYIHSSTRACVHKYKYIHTLSYTYISLYTYIHLYILIYLSLIHIWRCRRRG